MDVILDLYNFDSPVADGSKYVLTSPRSLEACSRLKVKPVELLQKSEDEFSQENAGKSIKLIGVLYKDWEEKRLSLLHKCRQEREKIMMEQQTTKKRQTQKPHFRNVPIKEEQSSKSITKPTIHTKSVFTSSLNTPLISINSPPNEASESRINTSSSSTSPNKSLIINRSDGLRCNSMQDELRENRLKASNSTIRSRSVFDSKSNLSSGYITPQIQRDRKLVELMKERREQDAKDEKARRNKVLKWSKEQKEAEEIKKKESLHRRKELAESRLIWEKKLRGEEERKVKKLRTLEEELLQKQEQQDAIIKLNIEKQERLRLRQIEERKNIALEKKQKQEKSLNEANMEILTFQKTVESDLMNKQEKASQKKLENEMKELQKVKMMNRKQHERYIEIQSELKRRSNIEEAMKREILNKKLQKAAQNYSHTVTNRDLNIKNQAKEISEKINQTKKNQKRIDREYEDYMKTIVHVKNKKTERASNLAQETTLSKAVRAKNIRMAGETEWKKNLQLIHKKDKELTERMKVSLDLKEEKVKRHVHLKEAALEFSRVQAKINEAERESIKRKSTNFHQMAQNAKITADIGRGPRSSFVNYSTVKLG